MSPAITRSGGPRAVRGLHEVCADSGRRDEGEHADPGDPFELTGLDALDDDLGQGGDEPVEDSRADHVEQGAHPAAQDQPAGAEDDDDYEQERQDREELTVGDLLLGRVDRREEHEEEDATDAAHDGGQRLPRRRVAGDPRVQQGGDHEGDRPERLDDDQRRLHEGGELTDHGESEHQRADEP